jgi:uncharacterized membrane protein
VPGACPAHLVAKLNRRMSTKRVCYVRRYGDSFRSTRFARCLCVFLIAILVAAGLFAPAAPAWSATPSDPAPAARVWSGIPDDLQPILDSRSPTNASFKHSGLKTGTYEIGNAINNFAILSVGAGGLTGGLILTAFNTLQSWTVYTTNDYLWQKYYPPKPSNEDNGPFDVKQSVWRTTLKYMTGKPVVAAIKITAIYIYTGSAATAFGYGLAATAGASAVFYINNLAWDYYDQAVAPPNAFNVNQRKP